MLNKLKPASGYTLMELIAVLALVGILVAVALPSFQSVFNENKIKNTAYQLQSVFKLARSEAAKREKSINLVASDNQWSATLGSEVLSIFKPNYDSVFIDGGLSDLTIDSMGAASSRSFVITDNDSSTDDYCFMIYVSGQSQLTKKASCS